MKHVHRTFALALLGLLFLLPNAQASSSNDEAHLHSALFGTREAYSTDIGRFYKWTGMLKRWTEERQLASGP